MALLDILKQLNWLDFFVVILLLRVGYVSVKNGLPLELFKFIGIVSAVYISLHYYTALSDLLYKRFMPKSMPLEFTDFVVFLLLITAGYLGFVGLRSVLFRFVQLNAVPRINQVAGLILGIFRGFLVVGLISFTLAISTVHYFTNSVRHSYLGRRAITISPRTYDWLWGNIFSKFLSQEKYNATISEAISKLNQK